LGGLELDTFRDGDALAPVIRRAARSVSYQWPGVVEVDDVAQEIYLRLLESPGSTRKLLEMEEDARYRAVIGIGHQLAARERDTYEQFTANFFYSVDDVKNLLSKGALTGDMSGYVDALIDLDHGMNVLMMEHPEYFTAIHLRYEHAEVPSSGQAKMRLSRALTKLTDEMNRSERTRYAERDDGPGTKPKVVEPEW